MNENLTFYLSIATFVVSLAVIAGIVWFGILIFQKRYREYPLYDLLIERFLHSNQSLQVYFAKTLADLVSESQERRNEFWNSYGQIVLSVFIIAVITILLLTQTIDPDAGLPILSGIAGFAIAKGVSTSRAQAGGVQYQDRE